MAVNCTVCNNTVTSADVGDEHVCKKHLVPQGSRNCCQHRIDSNRRLFHDNVFVRQLSPEEARGLLGNSCGPNCADAEVDEVIIEGVEGDVADRDRLILG